MDFVKLEEVGKKIFSKFPKTRRLAKGIYQRIMYLLTKENIKFEGDIEKISPNDEYEYFYGYYDKSPWDKDDRYILSLRVKNAYKVPDSTEEAEIVVFDTREKNKMIIIGKTHCWNSQQGCMAQWLGPDFSQYIIYNDFRDNKFISVIYDFKNKYEYKKFDMPIYDVSKDGKFALTLDFSRLHRLRKGYGYANLKEINEKEKCPNSSCIWKIDFRTNEVSEVIKYTDLKNFEEKDSMVGAEHKVNHIMISPNGRRFMVLHRWFKNNEKFTRLVTMDIDGNNKYNLSDDNFVSHCCWKNDFEILSFLEKKETGKHYYLMKDKTKEYRLLWDELNTDGHCTYSYDGNYIVTDTYPNRKRIATVYICSENGNVNKLARFFSPFKYDNDTRCDLHPRWNHNEDKICVDSVHEKKKALYIIKHPINNKTKKVTIIPKKIHSVWIGNGRKSKIVQKCEQSWKIFLKDYQVIEWSEKNFDLCNTPKYVKDAYKAKKWAFVSDYIRLKVLYDQGGIYLDTDMEILKDIEKLLNYKGFFCIESKHTISTAIIAAIPHARWIHNLLKEYDKTTFINPDGSYNLLPNTKRVQNYLENEYKYEWKNEIQIFDDGLVILPSEYFSPINCFNGRKKETINTLGIHLYDNTWKSKKEKRRKKIMQIITRIIGEDIRYKFSKKK